MSDLEPPPQDLNQLQLKKLAQEIEKLSVEIPKIRRESGWRATVIPSTVSIAAVVLSLVSLYNARQAQDYEQLKAERDFAVNCANSAADVAKLVFDKSETFDKLPAAGKINFVNVILASYPPLVAQRFVKALAPRVDPADTGSIWALQEALDRIAREIASNSGHPGTAEFPCPAVKDLIPVRPAASVVAGLSPSPVPIPLPVPTPAPTAGAQPAPPPTPAPVAPAPVPPATATADLTVYYQATRMEDRTQAEAIGQAVAKASAGSVGVHFPSAGVEVVSTAASVSQIEIRYYHRDQEDAARQLLSLVQQASGQSSGRIRFIGNSFPNLPQGRIEVWLPSLPWTNAYCYQESDQRKPASQRFLALCLPAKDQCDRVRGPNNSQGVAQSACAATDLTKASWSPLSGGINGARYQYSPTAFPPPFPQL
ncbi:MAG: hypothetical protein JSS43_06800 [Proteobacteria bacterium]|nr:hypothetical protein [Pseudomonadota bacterium]